MIPLIDNTESAIDDCAAIGAIDVLEQMCDVFRCLSRACQTRAQAIDHRFAGRIESAVQCEGRSDCEIRKARRSCGANG